MKAIYLGTLILLTLTTNLWAQNSFVPVCTADGNIRTLSNYNNQLYLGGWFNSINGVSASKIAKFNGQSFSQVGSGISGTYVDYFGIFNSNLLIGGNFPGSGSVANWNGSTISSMPGISGSTVSGGAVITCSAFFNGELWVGGDFSFPSKGLAKWNGTSWVGIGAGIDFSINNNFYVNDMIVYNNELYIGGVFTSVNGVAANYIAKFDGTNWTPVGSGLNQWAAAFLVDNNELIIGGEFSNAGGISANKIAKWNGSNWSNIGTDILSGYISELCLFNGEIYAGGDLSTQSGASYIAKWNGSFWQAVGGGTNGAVSAICEFNGELYIGGTFTTANNSACKLAKLAPSLPTPTLNISPTNASICNGQSATLTINASANNIICAASGLPSSLTTGLIGYWPFCGNANDVSGNGNNGTVNGATLTTDRFGNANSAYNFDGVDDYIYVPYQSSLNSSSISISGWMNASQLGGVRGLVSRWNQSNNPCVNYCTSIDNITNNFVGASSLYTNTVLFSNNSIQTNQWYHFSYVHNQISGGTLYLNGIAVATNLLSGSICGSNNDLYFGAQINVSSLFRFFAGKLDDIGIWNRALTASEIQQLYTQGQATYSWSPGGATTPSITVSPTTTTTYTCTITNGGATSTLTQTVTVNPLPTVNAGADQTVFAGSSLTLTGSGATTYSWDNGITNNTSFTANATTTYTVTGTSNGCTATDQVLVTVLPAPTVSASSSTICAGQSTTLTAASASTGTPCASTGLPSTLTNGLVGYWPFCGNANDASGNGNNGTVNGATLTTDRFGNANSAYSFDGNDWIEANVPNLPIGNSQRSISIWTNLFSYSNVGGSAFHYGSISYNNRFCLLYWPNHPAVIGEGNDACYNCSGTNTYSNAIAQLNNWNHVVITFNGNSVFVYINGLLSFEASKNYNTLLSNLRIGKAVDSHWSGEYFIGKLDDIGIWNRALTASEIQQLYTQGQATYSWSPGGATTPSITVSPTTTTTYTCTITNGGATSTLTQTVTVNPLPTVNAGADQTVFAGSSLTLTGSGATTYSWDNGITNNTSFTANATTTYTVTGTSNGCTATDQVVVTVLPAPTVSASSSTICAGQSTTLTAASASTGTPCAATGLQSTLTNGLVGYWPFCGNANDVSGNGNDGTVNGATLTTDRFGGVNSAYNFDGTDDFISVNASTTLNCNNSISISAWINPTILTTTEQSIVSRERFAGGTSYRVATNLANLGFAINNDPPGGGCGSACNKGVSASLPISTNNWQLVTATWDGNTCKIYVNGVFQATSDGILGNGGSLLNSSMPLFFGKWMANFIPSLGFQFFNGSIDDIGIWNRALTATEIQQLYTQGQTTYSWSPGGATTSSITVSPTTTTTYTCTITNGGATSTLTQTVTVNPLPTVNAGSDQTVFAGNSVTLAGSGATSYTWSNGITNNTPFTASATTTYTVTGTSNGCTATDQVLVTVLPAPTVSASSSTICAGQSTTLTTASASTGTPCASTGLPSSLTTGLVGYWPFCGNANDASGNGNNGTPINGAALTTDRFGNANSAYSFDGVNDYIEVPHSNSISITGDITMSAWVRTNGSNGQNYQTIISKRETYWTWEYNMTLSYHTNIVHNTKLIGSRAIGAGQQEQVWSNTPYSQNQWEHWVVNISGGQLKIYKNGILDISQSFSMVPFSQICPLLFGRNSLADMSEQFFGSLDDIGIWNRALTATEIQQLYTQGQATYSWSPGGATTPSITVSPTTTTTYTCTITNGGATSTLTQTVTVNPLPTVYAGSDQTVFAGSSVTLAGSGATSYTWNNGITNNTPFTANATTTYTVTGTSNGCTATDQVLVTVLPAPTVSASSSTICAGQSTTLTAASASTGTPCASTGLPSTLTNGLVGYWPFCGNANDASGNGYNGSVNGATLTTDRFGNANSAYNFNGTSNFISLSNTGNINFAQGITFSGWIRSSDIRMASIVDKETYPSNSGYRLNIRDNSSICAEHGSYGSPYPGAATPFAMSSYSPNIWVFVVGTLNPVTNLNSIYINGNLINSVAISTMINNNKTIEVGKSTLVQGEYFNGIIDDIGIWNRALTATEIQQLYTQGQATYSWSPGGATTPSITVSPTTTTTTYTCTITNGGATSTLTQTVTVNPLPTVNAGSDQTVFAGNSVTLAGSGATSYTWNNGITNNTPFTANATTTYTVTGTSNGCSATDQVLVTVLPAPTVSASSSTICAGQSTTLTAASASTGTPCAATGLPSSLTTGLVGYWPFCGNANDSSGNGNNGTVNGATLTSDRFGSANSAYSFDGNDLISINHSSSLLFNQETVSVSYWFSTSSWPTFPESYILSKQTNVGTNQTGFHSYIANQNAISFRYKNGLSNPQGNISATVSSNSNNWINISVVHTSTTDFIYLNGILYSSNPSVSLGGNNTGNLIFGALGSNYSYFYNGKLDDIGIWNRALTASEIQQLYAQGQATYSWSPGGATTPSITVSPTTTTTYTCTITQGGATSTLTQTITVNPVPTVNAGADQTVFAGSSVTLAGSGATSYTWNNGVTNNTPFTASATTTYTVTGTSNGCTATDQVLVTVLPAPTVSASSSTICAGQSTTLTAASASAGTPCAATGLPSSLNTGLVGYWPFCGNANDVSGNGNNGTVNGATLTTDRFGNTNSAYSFDGVNDNIIVPNSQTFQTNIWSISSWFKTSFLGYNRITSKDSPSSPYNDMSLIVLNGNLYISSSLNGQINNPQPICNTFVADNNWHHVVAMRSNGYFYIYIDGLFCSSVIDNFTQLSNSNTFYIGSPSPYPSQYFNGKLDDIGIWNRALTASEIQQLYTQGQATYSWSPGGANTPSITVSPTATTTYTCTVTVNGVSTNVSQTVVVNAVPTVNAGADQTVFAGSSVTLAGSGATSYSWNNGVTNNTPFTASATTTYTVTGTSNGCTATDQVLVTVLPAPTVSASTSTICAGQSTTLTATSASTGTPCAATGLPSSLNNGLVGYWPFCGNANDASGNGNNGTPINGAALTTDRFGNSNSAYSFDGVNDYINVGNSTLFNLNNMSISVWYNENSFPANGTSHALISKSTSNSGQIGYRIEVAPDGSSYYVLSQMGIIQGGTGYVQGAPVNLSSWENIIIVRSGSTVTLYKNGVSIGSNTNLSALVNNTNNLLFGALTNLSVGGFFNGKLDDIGIWNRALTAAEIQQLYTQGQTTYSWSPGGANTPSITVSPTTTTTYTCTVTNGGATTTVSQTVVVNAVPTVNAGIDQTVFAGNLVTLSGSGAASYSWDNGVSNNVPFAAATTTNYTVTGTTNGCSSTDQVLVTVLPNATISVTNTTLCAGQSTTITANVSALSAPCSSSGLPGTLNTGLVGYWPFCGNANDASGNGNNGTVNGATLTTDRFGNANSAYSFDGVNDLINVNRNHLPVFTASVWVNPSQSTCQLPILDAYQNSWELYSDCNNGQLSVVIWPPIGGAYTFYSSNNALTPNVWSHVSMVYNAQNLKIYVNGNLVLNTSTNVIPAISGIMNFGASISGTPQYFPGQLDDIGIWNRALTASEIQQLYTQGQATYAWSPGGATTPSITVSPTTTTTYTCTVTVNGVSTNVSQTITVNPSTNVNAGPNQTVCSGTPVTLTATGASTYSWTNGVQNGVPFTPTATQTYTVTGNNAFGCSSTSSVTVTVNPTPTATISYTGSLILCQGSTITLNASAGSSYLWSNGATTQSITVGQAGNYSVQVFNASGCSATSSAVAVVVNPLPAPTIIASGPLTFCQGGSVTLTSTGAQSYLWNNSATSQAINVSTSGSYTVTVVNDKGCTGTSAPVLVTVISNPPANINVIGGTSICAGQSTTLSAPAGYNYIWNTGAQSQFLTVTQSGTYTVQVTNANGCSTVSASVQITINSLPNATISASGPTNFCQGQSVMLSAPSASSYLWSNGAQTQSIIVSTAGTYSVTVTGQGGCTATSTPVTVNVYALPSPTIFASGSTTFCQGGSVILSAPSGYTYLWTTGSPLQNIIVTNSGTYQVLISNAFGCQIMSNPATVVVNPLPNVNAGMDQTVCAGTPVTLLGSGANSFSWNNGVSNGVPFVPTSTQTYTVTGTNSFGCTAQDQVLVTVNALPTVSAGPNQNICAGQSAVLVGTGAQYYLWSGGVINGIPFTPLATQTYTVTGYNAAGCSNMASTTITVNPLPTVVPGANATITCSNSASGVQIGSAPVAGLQYSWSPTTGLSSPFVANPFANPTTTTNYSLLVTNASGCSNLGQVTVNVNTTAPLALAGPNVEILCSNPNGVSIGAAPVAGLTYSWSPSTGLSASNIANPIANPNTTTIYMLTVTNPTTGCSANASVTVFVNNTSPTVNAGPDLQVCQGQAVTLNGSGLNANTLTWNNGVVNGVPFVPTSTGTYTLTGTNSANGCNATDQVVITVNPLPTVSAGNNLQICAGTAVTLNGSGASAYTWNNGVTNGVAFTPTATQTYTVTGTNSNGCSNTASVTVTILPGIVVSAGPDQTVCAGTAVTLNGFGANSYSWNNNVSNGVSFIPTTTQTYTVTGTNGNGCAGTDDVTITVVPAPLAQITPAGPLTLCPGGSIILSTGNASTYQWRLNGSNIPNQTQQSYTATAAGIYTVKVTNANGCSVISAPVQINNGTTPTANITASGPTAICAGSNVVLTSSAAASYQWLNNNTPIVNQTNQSLTVSAPGNYSVTITNAAGCTATSNIIQVSTAPNPVPVISANGPTAICTGSTLQLSTTAAGTFQWYLDGLPIAGATSNSYGATLAGNYSLMVNYASGCQGTSTALTVTLGPPPVPTITPTGPLSLCSGGSVTMTVSAAASYQWKLNGTAIAGALGQSYTATAPGSYTVTVVYPNGCTATSAAVIVNGNSITTPVIVANGSTTICAGSSVELIASGTGSFAWNLNGNPILPAVNSPNLIATAAGDYTVTVSNAAGCSATSNPTTITVVSLAAPTITASGPTTICTGANLTLSTTASGPYQWKLNGAPISGGNSSSITVNASGVYSLTVSNASGCSANSNNLTVTVVPLPTVSISANGPTVICQGSSVQLGAIATPGCTYQWKRNGIPQSNGQAATFMANNTGSYTVTVTNATGCQTTSNVIVVSHLQGTLTALGSTTICQGSSVTLQATTGAGYSYQWIKNGQYALNSTPNASLTVTTSGTYQVEITTPSGCVLMTNAIQVTVIQNPTATLTATGSTTICSGSSMTLLVNNGGPNVTYQWKKNGVNIQNANGTSLTVTEAGIYTVAVANIACPTSSQVISNAITITVNPTPTPNINTTATTIPLGSSVTLFTTNVAGLTYQWQKLNGNVWQNINGATNTSYSANTAGAYRVKATNSFGCSGYSSVVNLIMSQMPPNDDVVKIGSELNIALYPNPTNEVIYLDVPDTLIGQTYTILDINGRILFKETILEKTSTISVLHLARGTYWIQMENTQPLQFVKN